MTLTYDVCRCHDSGFSERTDCLRWLCREGPIDNRNQMASLFPYDIPIGSACPMKIVENER